VDVLQAQLIAWQVLLTLYFTTLVATTYTACSHTKPVSLVVNTVGHSSERVLFDTSSILQH
jgi:hypothetical protein